MKECLHPQRLSISYSPTFHFVGIPAVVVEK